jgi:hypothetical protein
MKLKFGELVCSECDGTGEGKTKKFKYIKNVNKDIEIWLNNKNRPYNQFCNKCKGQCKVDWIENITGV